MGDALSHSTSVPISYRSAKTISNDNAKQNFGTYGKMAESLKVGVGVMEFNESGTASPQIMDAQEARSELLRVVEALKEYREKTGNEEFRGGNVEEWITLLEMARNVISALAQSITEDRAPQEDFELNETWPSRIKKTNRGAEVWVDKSQTRQTVQAGVEIEGHVFARKDSGERHIQSAVTELERSLLRFLDEQAIK